MSRSFVPVRARIIGRSISSRALSERFPCLETDEGFITADIAGAIHFPAVRRITQMVLHCDPLGELPGLSEYVDRMDRRPTVQRVHADRWQDFPDFIEHIRKRFAAGT